MKSKNNKEEIAVENKINNKEKKRQILLAVAGIAPIIIVSSTLFSMFGWLFRYKLQSLLWPLAIIFLVLDLIFWIIPDLDILSVKRRKLIISYRIIFSLTGGVLFVIDAFLFIDNKIYSLMLITIVLCFFVGSILLKKLFKDFNKNTY